LLYITPSMKPFFILCFSSLITCDRTIRQQQLRYLHSSRPVISSNAFSANQFATTHRKSKRVTGSSTFWTTKLAK
jgi:hypothetical protein